MSSFVFQIGAFAIDAQPLHSFHIRYLARLETLITSMKIDIFRIINGDWKLKMLVTFLYMHVRCML